MQCLFMLTDCKIMRKDQKYSLSSIPLPPVRSTIPLEQPYLPLLLRQRPLFLLQYDLGPHQAFQQCEIRILDR